MPIKRNQLAASIQEPVIPTVTNPKVFNFLMTQEGNNAPTVFIISDDISGIAFSRSEAGKYLATKEGAFLEKFTLPGTTATRTTDADGNIFEMLWIDENTIQFTSTLSDGTPTDGLYTNRHCVISVYEFQEQPFVWDYEGMLTVGEFDLSAYGGTGIIYGYSPPDMGMSFGSTAPPATYFGIMYSPIDIPAMGIIANQINIMSNVSDIEINGTVYSDGVYNESQGTTIFSNVVIPDVMYTGNVISLKYKLATP